MAQNKAVKIETEDANAVVTLLEGRASVLKEGLKTPKTLSQGDRLTRGDRVTTEIKSRIEIKMPDKSVIRFDEKTTFVLESVAYDQKTQKKDINVNMILGKTWANVPKFSGSRGRFEITTKTAVAGVRGTDFRMNLNADNSAVLKVYEGEVAVSKRTDAGVAETTAKLAKPTRVAGLSLWQVPIRYPWKSGPISSAPCSRLTSKRTAAPQNRFDLTLPRIWTNGFAGTRLGIS